MKRSLSKKFSGSADLFRFCSKFLAEKEKSKINDQEIGNILDLNPSDCSHWKKGEKMMKSIFSFEILSKNLQVEESTLWKIVSESLDSDTAIWNVQFVNKIKAIESSLKQKSLLQETKIIETFSQHVLHLAQAQTAPVFLQEIFRIFPFVSLQTHDFLQKQTRILSIKKKQYVIQHKKGEMTPETRTSLLLDLGTILFDLERSRFPELGEKPDQDVLTYEAYLFASHILIPEPLIQEEFQNLEQPIHIIEQLAKAFWVPKALISWKIKKNIEKIKSSILSKEEKSNPFKTFQTSFEEKTRTL